ncbi:hypothetical protein WMF04_12390 [Sorangium sp. So ce260]|uniref:hypothetical protein n=1 Tax=Sorangium sp. So ce260 TaxID=3133291 RepID=UPI003F631C59
MKTLLLSSPLVLVALAGLAGCHKEAPAQAPAAVDAMPRTQDAAATGAPPADGSAPPADGSVPPADGSGAASEPRCEADADCVASCARAGQCCDQLCPPCDQAFHRDALAALQQWRAASCAAASCPMAKCMAPKEDSVARCKAGQCVVERVPHVEQ